MIRRHSLVWLREPPRHAPTAVVDWHTAGRPFIVCRTRPGEELSLGFCLPSPSGGKPVTHACASEFSQVLKVERPPEFRSITSGAIGLPNRARATLSDPPCGIRIRLIGSRMWEQLTGLPCVRRESDWDLVVDLDRASSADAAVDFLMAADFPLDAEIAFPDGCDVHWREWAAGADPLLAKSQIDVRLRSRSDVLQLGAATDRPGPEELAERAVQALLDEVSLYPKPGLVSPVDTGSHADMNAELLQISARTLRPFFEELAVAGRQGAGFFDGLVPVGIRAEAAMMRATGGVNTHRGGIFALGLLTAAAARVHPLSPAEHVRRELQSLWSPELQAHAERGTRIRRDGHQTPADANGSGARREAADGFPSIFEGALPHYQRAIAEGLDRERAAVDTIFFLISRMDDTNLLHRGGADGLEFAKHAATGFLEAGGVRSIGWRDRAVAVHRQFVTRNLSPGGAADLLAATLFIHRLGER